MLSVGTYLRALALKDFTYIRLLIIHCVHVCVSVCLTKLWPEEREEEREKHWFH